MVRSEGRALRVNQRDAARERCETAVLVGLWGRLKRASTRGCRPLAGLTTDKVSRETVASIGFGCRRCNSCSLRDAANYGIAGSSPAPGIEHSLLSHGAAALYWSGRSVGPVHATDSRDRQGPDRGDSSGVPIVAPGMVPHNVVLFHAKSRIRGAPASPPGLPAQDPVGVRWDGLHANLERPLHLTQQSTGMCASMVHRSIPLRNSDPGGV